MTKANPEKISRTAAVELLMAHRNVGKGKLFSVVFTPKDGGADRPMLARFAVKKGLSSVKKGLIPSPDVTPEAMQRRAAQEALGSMNVWDMQAGDYRKIYLPGLKQLKVGGKSYVVG